MTHLAHRQSRVSRLFSEAYEEVVSGRYKDVYVSDSKVKEVCRAMEKAYEEVSQKESFKEMMNYAKNYKRS